MVKRTTKGVILITGAAQRVGYYCVQKLIEQEERVVITYRTRREVIDKLEKQGVVCLQADFTQVEDIDRLIKYLHEDIGPLRAIIHNASSWLKDVNVPIDYAEAMMQVAQIHMLAPYMINMKCQDLLLDGCSPWSDIIHITDYVVEKGSNNHIAYAASKAGLDNMTRSFAKLYAPHIKVNSIAPSLLMFHDADSAEYRERTLKKSSMGIEPGPEVICQAIQYILDNSYMTGRELKLDGGRHIR